MFEAVVNDLFSNFDSVFTGSAILTSDEDWVLRVLVTGWEKEAPAPSIRMRLAQAIGALLAVSNNSSLYQVKGISLQQVPSGTEVGYYDPSFYTLPLGSGYTDTLSAGDNTWVIDLVFRPKATEKANINLAAWRKYLQGALAGSSGQPTVWIVALIPLRATSVGLSQGIYDAANIFWAKTQPFMEFTRVASAASPTGYAYDQHFQVNNSGPAWASYPNIGQGGVGFALGSAFFPNTLQPLPDAGTIIPSPPVTPVDPANPISPPFSWSALSTGEKAVGVAAGLLIGYGIAKWYLRW